jgi:hypothetical protein
MNRGLYAKEPVKNWPLPALMVMGKQQRRDTS